MTRPIFTIGHSNRRIEEFVDLVRAQSVDLVVDVRRLPGSRRHPQYDEDALRGSLAEVGIELQRSIGLTGRRGRDRDIADEVNGWWQNRSFHNYADHALGPEFAEALAGLRTAARSRTVTVMCSEAVWWRCHRRIIADHLLGHGDAVAHIIGAGEPAPADLSSGAMVGADGSVTYPADGSGTPD